MIQAYEVKLNETLPIIEIVHTGVLSSENLQKATDDAVALHKESGLNSCLIDASEMEFVEAFSDLYELPDQYSEAGVSRRIHIAIVMPKESTARKAAQFYDDLCHNRGWVTRAVDSREEAVKWLMSENTS